MVIVDELSCQTRAEWIPRMSQALLPDGALGSREPAGLGILASERPMMPAMSPDIDAVRRIKALRGSWTRFVRKSSCSDLASSCTRTEPSVASARCRIGAERI